jgi:hypothetical protein
LVQTCVRDTVLRVALLACSSRPDRLKIPSRDRPTGRASASQPRQSACA